MPMTYDEQLAEWLKGNSIHNDDTESCCPDFSCCLPDLLVDQQTRQAFVNANEELRMSMLGMFFGKAIEQMTKGDGKKVYVVGADDLEGMGNASN